MAVQPGGQDDQVYVAILILFFVNAVLAIVGPIGVAMASVTIIIGIIAGLGHAGRARWPAIPRSYTRTMPA